MVEGKKHEHPERRYIGGVEFEQVETRAEGDEGKKIYRGLASRYDVDYVLYEDETYKERWVERIEKGAFSDVLKEDVRVLFNHDDNKILARTGSGTARVWETEDGLMYEWQNEDNISYARDLALSIARGDVKESSFAFTLKRDGYDWVIREQDDGWVEYRHIIKPGGVRNLYDVSPVVFPANPATYVQKNSLAENYLDKWRVEVEAKRNKERKNEGAEILRTIEMGLKIKRRHLKC